MLVTKVTPHRALTNREPSNIHVKFMQKEMNKTSPYPGETSVLAVICIKLPSVRRLTNDQSCRCETKAASGWSQLEKRIGFSAFDFLCGKSKTAALALELFVKQQEPKRTLKTTKSLPFGVCATECFEIIKQGFRRMLSVSQFIYLEEQSKLMMDAMPKRTDSKQEDFFTVRRKRGKKNTKHDTTLAWSCVMYLSAKNQSNLLCQYF